MSSNSQIAVIAGAFLGYNYWKSIGIIVVTISVLVFLDLNYDVPWNIFWSILSVAFWARVIFLIYSKIKTTSNRLKKNDR